MRARRIAAVTTATVLAFAGLAACGGDDEKDNTGTDAKTLADEAIAFSNKQGSVELESKGTDEEGKPAELTGCSNFAEDGKTLSVKTAMTLGGHKVEMVEVDGKQYTKAPVQFYIDQSENPDKIDEAAMDKALAGKWIVRDAEPDEDDEFFDNDTSGVTKGDVMEFAGKKVVPLKKTNKDGVEETVYVAAKGDPEIIGSLEVDGESRTEVTVKGYGEKCDATAPPKDQTQTKEEFEQAYEEAGGA